MPYTEGFYDVKKLREMWKRDLTPDERETEKENIIVFDQSNGNPFMKRPKIFSENNEGVEKNFFDEDGAEVIGSYSLSYAEHYDSVYDIWVVLNSLVKEMTNLKIIKTALGLI